MVLAFVGLVASLSGTKTISSENKRTILVRFWFVAVDISSEK